MVLFVACMLGLERHPSCWWQSVGSLVWCWLLVRHDTVLIAMCIYGCSGNVSSMVPQVTRVTVCGTLGPCPPRSICVLLQRRLRSRGRRCGWQLQSECGCCDE